MRAQLKNVNSSGFMLGNQLDLTFLLGRILLFPPHTSNPLLEDKKSLLIMYKNV